MELEKSMAFKLPTFQERAALAAKAKQAALDKLRAKPPVAVDEAVVAQRREARLAREAAAAAARTEKLAARELEKARKKEEDALKAAEAAPPPALSEAEQKAIRDAKYAARKNRVGRR